MAWLGYSINPLRPLATGILRNDMGSGSVVTAYYHNKYGDLYAATDEGMTCRRYKNGVLQQTITLTWSSSYDDVTRFCFWTDDYFYLVRCNASQNNTTLNFYLDKYTYDGVTPLSTTTMLSYYKAGGSLIANEAPESAVAMYPDYENKRFYVLMGGRLYVPGTYYSCYRVQEYSFAGTLDHTIIDIDTASYAAGCETADVQYWDGYVYHGGRVNGSDYEYYKVARTTSGSGSKGTLFSTSNLALGGGYGLYHIYGSGTTLYHVDGGSWSLGTYIASAGRGYIMKKTSANKDYRILTVVPGSNIMYDLTLTDAGAVVMNASKAITGSSWPTTNTQGLHIPYRNVNQIDAEVHFGSGDQMISFAPPNKDIT